MSPSSVSIGFNPISTGNSLPSFLRPNRSRLAPIDRGRGSAKKRRAHFRMITAEPFRDEHFYRLTQKLGARIPKYPLGLSIHHDNLARPVDHHHGIRRSLDDQPKAILGGYPLVRLMLVVRILAIREDFSLRSHRVVVLLRSLFVRNESEFGFDTVGFRFQTLWLCAAVLPRSMDCRRVPQIRGTRLPAAVACLRQASERLPSTFGESVDTLRWRSTLYSSFLSGFVQMNLSFLWMPVDLPQQPRELVLQHAVAFAGVGFKPVAVQDCQPAASVADSPGALKGLGCN